MKVLFVFNVLGFQYPGGGETQVVKSREYLEHLGVKVDLFDPFKKICSYDIVHSFGLRYHTYEVSAYCKQVLNKKLLVSPLWWSVGEYYIKSGSPQLFLRNKLFSILRRTSIFTRAQKWFNLAIDFKGMAVSFADRVIATSNRECEILEREFSIEKGKLFVVPNGVDPKFLKAKPELFTEKYGISDFVLCVSNIYPKKNQLALITALKGTSFPLVFIGAPIYDKHYFELCIKEARNRGNTHFIGYLPHESELLASAYAASELVVLPSWFDAPGLVTLEGALAGTKVVITNRGPMKEYFGDLVTYLDPSSLSDIRRKILDAYSRPKDGGRLQKHVRQNFTWPRVAEKLKCCYEEILS